MQDIQIADLAFVVGGQFLGGSTPPGGPSPTRPSQTAPGGGSLGQFHNSLGQGEAAARRGVSAGGGGKQNSMTEPTLYR